MASNKRTIYLGLDYSQFSGGVTEINRKMSLLDSEFKLATEQAKHYGTETDELGVKTDYLTQKIALQNQKVEEAKRAYDEAMKSQNASSKEIDALDKKLLDERTKLEQLNRQLDDNKKATDKATGANKTFGDEIRSVASSLGINISPAIEKLAKKFDGVSAAVGNCVLVLGAMVTGLFKCTMAAAENADELMTLSKTTGLTTDQLQKMKYAADFVDVSFDTMISMTTKLEQSMIKAKNGSKEAEDAFKKLHIRIKDGKGNLRDQNVIFEETIDALKKVKSETQRDELAFQLFGKSAKELNPLIEAGSKGLHKFYDEAENVSGIMSEEELGKLNEFKDQWDKFSKTMESLKNSLGVILLPILTTLFEVISKIPEPVLRLLVIITASVVAIVSLVKAIKSISDTATGISKFFSMFNDEGTKTKAIIIGIVVALLALATIIAIILGKSDDIQKSMESVGKMSSGIQESVNSAETKAYNVKANYTGRNARGTDNWSGGKTWLGEEGPELVTLPKGSKITPANEAAAAGTTINYNYITIDAKNVQDFNRVVDLAQQQRMGIRRT